MANARAGTSATANSGHAAGPAEGKKGETDFRVTYQDGFGAGTSKENKGDKKQANSSKSPAQLAEEAKNRTIGHYVVGKSSTFEGLFRNETLLQ